ncbi:MAG: efflux RND transporter permease subunit, partial [Polyangiaceae bacterium]
MIPYIHVKDIPIGPIPFIGTTIPLHPFGILVATGVLLGTALATWRARIRNVDLDKLNSFITWMLVAGFCGGHMLDTIFYHPTEIARIVDGPKEPEQYSFLGFGPGTHTKSATTALQPAVTLSIDKRAGANSVTLANAVLAKLNELKLRAIPEGVQVTVTRDDGAKADEAVNTLIEHLGIAVISVAIILLLFLGWREAAIVTLTVPLVLGVVLGVGWLIGQTINRITLFALILSLGLLVDDAIVVIENIHRRLHQRGKHRFQDRLVLATNEIGRPTNIATLAVILAFIPMAFVGGMMGP